MSRDGPTVYVYPTEEQKARWEDRADALGMSLSEFTQHMVEAGIRADQGFEVDVGRDETNRELREQRNDLKDELDHARQRITDLEDRLHRSEREAVRGFIEAHPGATFDEITRHVVDTVPERVNEHLEAMEGQEITVEDGKHYPAGGERAA